jgi:hypothetical protein
MGWQEYFFMVFNAGMIHDNSHVDENCGKLDACDGVKKSPPLPQVIDGCPAGCRGVSAPSANTICNYSIIRKNSAPLPRM